MEVPSGRLDILALAHKRIFLIELKIEPFKLEFIDKVLGYKKDLIELQNNGRLIAGEIDPILLVPQFRLSDLERCNEKGVLLKQYSPDKVLERFYNKMASISNFLTIRPMDYGVWNIHLINRALYALPQYSTVDQLFGVLKISKNTIRNHLRFAEQLLLANKFDDKYLLTDLGQKYVKLRDPSLSEKYAFLRSNQTVEKHYCKGSICIKYNFWNIQFSRNYIYFGTKFVSS